LEVLVAFLVFLVELGSAVEAGKAVAVDAIGATVEFGDEMLVEAESL